MKHVKSYIVVVALATSAVSALAQVLIVRGKMVPLAAEGSAPSTRVTSTQVQLKQIDKPTGGYEYSMNESVRLLASVEVSYSQTPQGYWATSLEVRVPYKASSPLQVSLYAVKPVDAGSEGRRIREIFATVIGGDTGVRSHDDLFKLYQEAGAIANRRMDRIRSQDDFNYLDAQLFFKYMELAVYLGREASLAVSSDVRDVHNFVRSQMQQAEGRRVVLKGTSQTPLAIESLLRFVDFVDADQLKRLWGTVKKQTNGSFSEEACKQYIAFSNTVTGGDYDQGLVEAWERYEDYRLVTLAAEAVSVCANEAQRAQAAGNATQEQVQAIVRATNGLERLSAPTARVTHSVKNIKRVLGL